MQDERAELRAPMFGSAKHMTMSDPFDGDKSSPLVDGRQSDTALELQRGVLRLLSQHACTGLTEFGLPDGRRADIFALTETGDIWIVEIKSSVIDFQSDHKWPDYVTYSDALFFAVKPDFPINILPEGTGLIIADNYGGELVRTPPDQPRLAAARRKSLTLRFAHAAARRLFEATEPSLRHKVWQDKRTTD